MDVIERREIFILSSMLVVIGLVIYPEAIYQRRKVASRSKKGVETLKGETGTS